MLRGLGLAILMIGSVGPSARLIAQSAPVAAASQPSAAETKASRKSAEKAYKHGLKEQEKQHLREAFEDFTRAAELAPSSVTYVTARESARQALVARLIEDGNREMDASHSIQALELFKQALQIDPENQFAKQRIYDALPPLTPVRVVRGGAELARLNAPTVRKRVQLQGTSQNALEQLARIYGITAFLDSSVPARPVNVKLDNVTWEEAADIVCRMTKTFWMPLASNQVMFAADDDATRRALQRMGMATFYVQPNSSQELNDLTNTLRVLFDIRFLNASPAEGTITVRAPQPVMEAATTFLEQMQERRPQVMLDVQVYSVSRDLARQIGTDVPDSFTIFNVPTEAQKLLGGQSIQDILNQLQNGTLNLNNSAGLAGLLAQAVSGGSPLTSPFLTFGGGLTLTGITVPGAGVKLNVNESTLHRLQHVNVRASQGTSAVIKIGQRYPIITASYSGAINIPGITNSKAALNSIIPNIQYEDLGLNLKATPRVSRSGLVTVDLEMQIRALEGPSVNGLPVLSNREFKSSLGTQDGQAIVVAGLITQSESRLLSGPPLISQLPVASTLLADRSRNKNDDEVLVVMTPHILYGAHADSHMIPVPNFIQR